MDFMAAEKTATTLQKRALAEKLWLTYFTQYLFHNNILTESERNRMLLKIESRKGSSAHNKQKQETHQEA